MHKRCLHVVHESQHAGPLFLQPLIDSFPISCGVVQVDIEDRRETQKLQEPLNDVAVFLHWKSCSSYAICIAYY